MVKKVPLPIAGVMLSLAVLGNLLQSYAEGIRMVCGVLSVVLGILLLIKLISYPQMIKEDMKNPIMASVSATFPMALMLLSVYAKPYIGKASLYFWYAAIALHIALIIYFTVRFLFHLEIKKVYASYFIPYVGIAVAAITAPAYEKIAVGKAAFWFAFLCFLFLFVLISYRYLTEKEIPPPAKPLFCIFTAPASLCLAGYLSAVFPKTEGIIYFLASLALLLYGIVLWKLPRFLKMPFFPSYAAFTFPFVISAVAMKQTSVYFSNAGMQASWLSYLVLLQTVLAVILVGYTLVRFIMFVFS